MSGYALYVAWGYGLSALELGALCWASWRAHRRAARAWQAQARAENLKR